MKKIYISIHSGYSLDMTTSSTPPSFPPPLLHVLTPGKRAGAECCQGGILEGRRNCFVLIKGMCKFPTRNKSPLPPISLLSSTPASCHHTLCFCPPLGLCCASHPSHVSRTNRTNAVPQSRTPLVELSIGNLSCHLPPSRDQSIHALRMHKPSDQGRWQGGVSVPSVLQEPWFCYLVQWLDVRALITDWKPRICCPFLEGELKNTVTVKK